MSLDVPFKIKINQHVNENNEVFTNQYKSLGKLLSAAPPNTYKCVSCATMVCPYLLDGGGEVPFNKCSVVILVHLNKKKV